MGRNISKNLMIVDVVYASEDKQLLLPCEMKEGATVETVIMESGILTEFPEINLVNQKVGVFGKLVNLDNVVADGDRIEIYRKLMIDPKAARFLRVEKEKEKKRIEEREKS